MTVLNTFPPLQAAIAHAESWRTYLNDCQDELRSPHAQDIVARAAHTVGIGVQLGALLPITWRAAFHSLFRPSLATWNSVKEFEDLRQQTRALFYTVREAMEGARKTAEILQALTGRRPVGTEQLLKAIDEARDLEESVFRDWPSFADRCTPIDSLAVEESLAELLGISADEARERMDARRQQQSARTE